jgi:hypothetical protein
MAKIKFNGEEYELVDFNTITIDEALILREYSDLNIDQVEDAGFHAGIIGALIHISVSRADPTITKKQLRELVGKMPMADLAQVFEDIATETDEDDARPPASPAPSGEPPEPAEPLKTDAPPESSGSGSEPISEIPAAPLRAIGSPG